jgi:hypothetical protein
MSDKIKKHIIEIYPKKFRYVVAFMFYFWVFVNVL